MASHSQAVSDGPFELNNKEEVRRVARELRYHQLKIEEALDSLLAEDKARVIPGFPATKEDLEKSKTIRRILELRDQRSALFGKDLFADPAWDILLELFSSSLNQRRVTVSRVCAASRVSGTTALRWLKTLEERELIRRQADPMDGRRVFISLTDRGLHLMREFYYLLTPEGSKPALGA